MCNSRRAAQRIWRLIRGRTKRPDPRHRGHGERGPKAFTGSLPAEQASSRTSEHTQHILRLDRALVLATRSIMTEFTQTLRHYCRNPRCRSKLPSPASDPREAFCTRGCHSSFYLKRCLVCENDKPAGSTTRRKLCRRPKCEGRYRKNSAHYSFLGPIHGH